MSRSWKPIAWFCISLLVFVVVAGPAVWAMLQKNERLTYTNQMQEIELTELNSRLSTFDDQVATEVENRLDEARQPLRTQLAEEEQKVQELTAQIALLDGRDAFAREMQSKLDDVISRIEELEQNADDASDEQEVKIRSQIAVLQTRHDQTEERLDALMAASPTKWKNLKDAVSQSWNQLSTVLGNEAEASTFAYADGAQ